MNEVLTHQVIQSCISCGVTEFVVCAGSRNSSFVEALRLEEKLTTYYWPEERSAAFFALGRTKLTGKPVAVVTTSGTATAELLPACMEAYYAGIPLVLITADRPPSFRGSGAPQSAEQVDLYGQYVQFCLDISQPGDCQLWDWQQKIPVHLNVCLDEPQKQPKFQAKTYSFEIYDHAPRQINLDKAEQALERFIEQVQNPIAIISTLRAEDRESVVKLLLDLQIPAMIEGISGLREDPRLQSLSIKRTDKVLETAVAAGYPIDGVLRIGGIPTHRIWRDLEYLEDKVDVCVLSDMPFSGLSWKLFDYHVPIAKLLQSFVPVKTFGSVVAKHWLQKENEFHEKLIALFEEEKYAEPSLIYSLSKQIPVAANIYLGNSLPIREWDMAATRENKGWAPNANRGVNGIDGQLSTFLGLCKKNCENWGIFGDLTTLYDMAGLWILPRLKETPVKIIVINNGGGKIFERMYPYKEMLNEHQLSFGPLAEMWSLDYTCLNQENNYQNSSENSSRQLIEIIPDEAATARFWSRYAKIDEGREALAHAASV